MPERGERLATEAERILSKYRDVLADRVCASISRARKNGTTPCLEGHSFGEAAQWLGATNTGGAIGSAPRRPLTVAEIRRVGARRDHHREQGLGSQLASADPAWREIDAVAAGHVHAPPDVPFNWGPRPPSVNRLLGLIWMAYVLPARPFDDAFFADVRTFFETFYHVTPTPEQLRR